MLYLVPRTADQRLSGELKHLRNTLARALSLESAQNATAPIQCASDVIEASETLYGPCDGSHSGGHAMADRSVPAWLNDLNAMPHAPSTANSGSTSRTPASSVPSVLDDDATDATSVERDHENAGSSDNGLDSDLAQAAFGAGTRAFQQGSYAEARGMLQEALDILNQLPVNIRSRHFIFEIRFGLAACAFHTRKWKDAEPALISVAQAQPRTYRERLQVCHAGHLVAHLYLRTGRFELARQSCDSSLLGHKRLVG